MATRIKQSEHPIDAIILTSCHMHNFTIWLEICYSTIWRCFRCHKLKPYKENILRNLEEGYLHRRIESEVVYGAKVVFYVIEN